MAAALAVLACGARPGGTAHTVYTSPPDQLALLAEFRRVLPPGPFCFSGLWWYGATVYHVSPEAESSGVRVGDEILRVEGRPYAPENVAVRWSSWEVSHAPGDRIELLLDRGGARVSATVTCGDGHAFARPMLAALEDLVAGRWRSCRSHLAEAEERGGALSELAGRDLKCVRVGWEESGGSAALRKEVALSLYQYARCLLRESRPAGTFAEVRPGILFIAAELESEGLGREAEELRIGLAEGAP